MNKEGIAKMSKRKYLEEPGQVKTCYIWNAPWEKVAARHYAGAGKRVASGAHGKKEGGSIHARNKLERLVCEAVAETLAQQELQAAGLLRDAGRGSDWVFGFAFLRRRCRRAGKVVT